MSASKRGDFSGVRQAPKVESHIHGPFGCDRAWLAARTVRDITPLEGPLASIAAMHAWTAAHIGDLFAGREVETLELDEAPQGIAPADSPTVMCVLADTGTVLNVCPTSNRLLGPVARLQDHLIKRLFDTGVKAPINSDDALVFSVGISEAFMALNKARVFTAAALDLARRWGLEAPLPSLRI